MPDPEMDCLEINEARLRGEPLSGAAEAHARSCPVCARTPADVSGTESTEAALASLEARVREERGLFGRARSLPTRTRVLVAAAWAAAIVLGVSLAAQRPDIAGSTLARTVLAWTVLAALLAVALRLGLRPLQAPPLSRRELVTALAAAFGFPIVLSLLPIPAKARIDEVAGVGASEATGLCLSFGVAVGIALIAVLRALDRGAHGARGPVILAAAAGGLLGNLALEAHCAINAPAHLLFGHATVGLVLVAAYTLLRRRRLV